MTIYPFALTPKMCDTCGRWFILERYVIKHKLVGIERDDIKVVRCLHCVRKG